MLRSVPLPAILLFLLLLNLVQTLDITNRQQRQEANASLSKRDDHYIFEIDVDDDDKNRTNDRMGDDKATSTKLSDVPTVTTIIIIQTSGGQTYREVGGSAASSTGSNGDNGAVDPNEDGLQTEDENDDSALKRMISIPTVIGGVAIAAIIIGTIVFMRLRAKRRHAKALQQCHELSTAYLRGNEAGNGTLHHHHGGGSGGGGGVGGGHQRQFSNSSTGTYATTQHHLQSPLSPLGNRDYATNTLGSVAPSAPLEPTISPTHLRERHMLSSLPQQFAPPTSPSSAPPSVPPSSTSSSSDPIPSAPSTKELEMNAPCAPGNVPRIITDFQPSASSSSSNSHDHPLSSSSTSSSSPTTTTTTTADLAPCSHLRPTNGTQTSKDLSSSQPPSTPEMPPPAYTPSAPPLFVLPPNQRRRSADQLSLDRYRRS